MSRSRAATQRYSKFIGLAAALAFALATPARTIPFTAFFDGNSTSGDPTTNFGMSASEATRARDDFGIQILENLAFVGEVTGTLSTNRSLQSVSQVDPPNTDVATGHSVWTVNNLLGDDLEGATLLLFTHTDPYTTAGGVEVAYDDANVGIVIDADLGWFIVEATAPGEGDFFYAALLLDPAVTNPTDGILPHDDPSSPFDVHYVVRNEPLVDSPDFSQDWQLPELQIGMAYEPVPEPGTAALLSLGSSSCACDGARLEALPSHCAAGARRARLRPRLRIRE